MMATTTSTTTSTAPSTVTSKTNSTNTSNSTSADLTSRFWDSEDEDEPELDHNIEKEIGNNIGKTDVNGIEKDKVDKPDVPLSEDVREELSTSGLFLELEPHRSLDLQLFLPSSVFVPGPPSADIEEDEEELFSSARGSRSSTPRGRDIQFRIEPEAEVQTEEQVNDETDTESQIESRPGLEPAIQFENDTTTADMGRLHNLPEDDTMKEVRLQIPVHPIPSMQAAFAESMLEANDPSIPPAKKGPVGNAAVRRKVLLDQEIGEETHASKWRQRPGQKYHELWKLMAQISFGVYLLMKGIAKDDDQVMNILQGHVDEIDEFLENTLEDFDLAQEDIEERLKFLKLPLENIIIFDAMLEDRAFRGQIVSGNERIEHVITRTATAMNDALKDVQQGLDACKEFTIYLAEEEKNAMWMKERPEMSKVFDAMKGNVEGWYKAYVSLQTKGHHLGVALVQLGSIVAEMDRRAADISRKSRFSTQSIQMASPPSSPPSNEMRKSMSKDLPSDPNIITPAIRATLPAFSLMADRERTPENDDIAELTEPEPEPELDFILKPTTYTPVPSPKPPSNSAPAKEYFPKPPSAPPVQEPPPAPEVTKRSSLRKRFSLKKNTDAKTEKDNGDDYWGPRQKVMSSAEKAKLKAKEITIQQRPQPRESRLNVQREPIREMSRERSQERLRETSSQNTLNVQREQVREKSQDRVPERVRESTLNLKRELARVSSREERAPESTFDQRREQIRGSPAQDHERIRESRVNGRPRETTITTPPSRGLDSAYCSDFDKHSPTAPPPNIPLQQTHSHTSNPSRTFIPAPIPSPLSDRQFFRPVQASPNSPLQRPWTAGPPQNSVHMHTNSSTSNLSSHRNNYHAHTPSSLGLHHRGAPSAMGMSVMSDMTTMTDIETGKKVKKKRSAFGWFKKAFSLDEEEKAAFESRKIEAVGERERYYQGRDPGDRKWVDGRRVDGNGGGRRPPTSNSSRREGSVRV